jgi:uncharacterized SAM-binding protein YcdF (DUF218 family)
VENSIKPKLALSKKIRRGFYIVGGGIGALLLGLYGFVGVRLAIASRTHPTPEAIMLLGGGKGREQFTVEFAKAHPSLDILASGVRFPDGLEVFRDAGIPENRLYSNIYAVDTVGNFAHTVEELQKRNVHHVYLITSDYHMSRAVAVATLILGTRGIAFTPVSIATNEPPETWSWLRITRDTSRSIFWIFTGRTGANFTIHLKLKR